MRRTNPWSCKLTQGLRTITASPNPAPAVRRSRLARWGLRPGSDGRLLPSSGPILLHALPRGLGKERAVISGTELLR